MRFVAPAHATVGAPPADLHCESVTLVSEFGAQIAGWYVPADGKRGVVVLLHSIRCSRLNLVQRARLFRDAGYAVLLIDLRAHGESSGDEITFGYLERHDVRAAVEFAKSRHPDEPIAVDGSSLGGAARSWHHRWASTHSSSNPSTRRLRKPSKTARGCKLARLARLRLPFSSGNSNVNWAFPPPICGRSTGSVRLVARCLCSQVATTCTRHWPSRSDCSSGRRAERARHLPRCGTHRPGALRSAAVSRCDVALPGCTHAADQADRSQLAMSRDQLLAGGSAEPRPQPPHPFGDSRPVVSSTTSTAASSSRYTMNTNVECVRRKPNSHGIVA